MKRFPVQLLSSNSSNQTSHCLNNNNKLLLARSFFNGSRNQLVENESGSKPSTSDFNKPSTSTIAENSSSASKPVLGRSAEFLSKFVGGNFSEKVKNAFQSPASFNPSCFISSSALAERVTPVDTLTVDNLNPKVLNCSYAVRGEIAIRAEMLEKQLKSRPGSLPFDEIVYCNIGNPHSLGQPPITYFREVTALCCHPALLDKSIADLEKVFSPDSISAAIKILNKIPNRVTGAYSHSQGIPVLREMVAQGIERRDGGYSCSVDDLFLTDGASPAVEALIHLFIRGRNDAFLVPVPQYPLYSASLELEGGTLVPYFLDEKGGWSLSLSELETRYDEATKKGINVRAMVVINPGNPTGQILSLENQKAVVEFCYGRGITLLADEVYQENIYSTSKPFHSFKKVVRNMGLSDKEFCLISFHSSSKGYYGECGRRGGYMEVYGMSEFGREQLYKIISVNLCSNTPGQFLMAMIMNPPQLGDPSYNSYIKEKDEVLSSLARRAKFMVERFRQLEGITCNDTEGAMYAFPRIDLPIAAVRTASDLGMEADEFYARRLLDATGIVVVPGSGFKQEPGTWHIRSTILPSEKMMGSMMDRFATFHSRFLQEFSS